MFRPGCVVCDTVKCELSFSFWISRCELRDECDRHAGEYSCTAVRTTRVSKVRGRKLRGGVADKHSPGSLLRDANVNNHFDCLSV